MDVDATVTVWREAAQVVRDIKTYTPPAGKDAWNSALERAALALDQRALEIERGDTEILEQLQRLFTQHQTDRISTIHILRELEKRGVSPDVPLDSRRLARELARHGVRPVTFDADGTSTKGYVTYPTKTQVGLAAAWRRYLADRAPQPQSQPPAHQ